MTFNCRQFALLLPGILVPFLISQSPAAEVLETEHYVVTITVNCCEGNVTCDDVAYHGVSKRTGRSITLKGRTMHSVGADGVTPSQFQGYQFRSGKITYTIYESGVLEVIRGKSELLVSEHGKWRE